MFLIGSNHIQYVRYADDFIVGVIGSHEDAKKLKQDLTAFLKEKLGLTLSAEKTKITNTAENARFLGYDIWSLTDQAHALGIPVFMKEDLVPIIGDENMIQEMPEEFNKVLEVQRSWQK